MLTELRIHNFAIIDDLDLHFGEGLTTFTGETGAGKSIIIDALETLLGNRVDVTMIRTETDSASIEGTFKIGESVRAEVHQLLEQEDLLDDQDFVVLAREIRRQGRTVARVNGRSVNAQLLRALGETLVDVHGQSDHLSLFRIREHLRFLDGYADVTPLLSAYQETYHRLRGVRAELQTLRETERDAARRTDMLHYQIGEIEAANLKPGEEEELRQERTRLANAETLSNLIQESLFVLDEGSPESQPVTDLLGKVVDALHQLERIDPSMVELSTRIQEIFEQVTDLTGELRGTQDTLEFNPRRLETVENRLDLIHGLKRKFGQTIPDILGFLEKARQQLESITHVEERISLLDAEEAQLLKELADRGVKLSEKRRSASQALSRGVEQELAHLRMDAARFDVEFTFHPDPKGIQLPDGQRVAFDATGIESVQFLVAPNPGEGLKPLAKIASGGEMSRVTLAIKNVLASADKTPTLVFDEIDQGIGGRVGSVVGEKLWRLARQHQVLCITHLPQLAAFGAQHYHVSKVVRDGRTTTHLQPLTGEVRIAELASMLGGVSEGTLQSAREILSQVDGLANHK